MEKKIVNILAKAGLTKEQALSMDRKTLLATPGIGPKTADAILAEAMTMDAKKVNKEAFEETVSEEAPAEETAHTAEKAVEAVEEPVAKEAVSVASEKKGLFNKIFGNKVPVAVEPDAISEECGSEPQKLEYRERPVLDVLEASLVSAWAVINYALQTAAENPEYELKIPNLDNCIDKVAIGESALSIWMQRNGIPADALLKLDSMYDRDGLTNLPSCEDNPEEFWKTALAAVDTEKTPEKSLERVKAIIAQGIMDKICNAHVLTIRDEDYKSLARGSTDIRMSSSVWCKAKYLDLIQDFMTLGRFKRLSKVLPMSKLLVYMMLCASNSKSFESVFGKKVAKWLKPQNINSAVVLKDVEWETMETFLDELGTDDELKLKVKKAILDKKSDGLIIHIIDDEQFKIDRSRVEVCSVRLHLMKGLMLQITKSAWHKLLDKIGKRELLDAYGVKKDVYDVETLVFTSAFKGWKGFDSWRDYVNQLKIYQSDEWRVCVKCRHGVTNLPTQQVRGLMMQPDMIRKAVNYNGKILNYYRTAEGVHSLVGGKFGEMIRLYPVLANSYLGKSTTRMAWKSKIGKVFGGSFLDTGTSAFVAPEIVPLVCRLFDVDPIYVLQTGELHYHAFPIGHRVLGSRNPFPAMNWVFGKNAEIPEEYKDFFLGGAVYINWHNPWMILCQMDFDGDKLNLIDVVPGTFTQYIWDAAIDGVKRYDYRPLFFDNNTPKNEWSEDADYEMIRTTSPAPIGLHDNDITILMGIYMEDEKGKKPGLLVRPDTKGMTPEQKSAAWDAARKEALMRLRMLHPYKEKEVTVCVDNAKNGGEPGETAASIQEWVAENGLKKSLCYAFKKCSLNVEGEYKKLVESGKYSINFNDPIEIFSSEMVMETAQEYSCAGIPIWDRLSYKKMTTGKASNRVRNLVHVPESKDERDSGKIGIFNKIAEWVKAHSRKNADGREVNRQAVVEEARELYFVEVGKVAQVSADELIDSTIMQCFILKPNKYQASDVENIQRLCVEMFGNEILENLRENLKITDESYIERDDDGDDENPYED